MNVEPVSQSQVYEKRGRRLEGPHDVAFYAVVTYPKSANVLSRAIDDEEPNVCPARCS